MTLLLFIVGALVIGGIGFAAGRYSAGLDRDLLGPPPALSGRLNPVRLQGLSPELLAEVKTLAAANRKIDAIKLVRESTGLGLAEAKDFVETL